MESNQGKPNMRNRRIFSAIAVAVILVGIFLFSAQNAETSQGISDSFLVTFLQMLPARFVHVLGDLDHGILSFLVRKAAHFSEYALLGFFMLRLLSTTPVLQIRMHAWLFATVYACTDELHQLFVSGRAARAVDVMIDSTGALTGVMIAWFLLQHSMKKHGTSKPKS